MRSSFFLAMVSCTQSMSRYNDLYLAAIWLFPKWRYVRSVELGISQKWYNHNCRPQHFTLITIPQNRQSWLMTEQLKEPVYEHFMEFLHMLPPCAAAAWTPKNAWTTYSIGYSFSTNRNAISQALPEHFFRPNYKNDIDLYTHRCFWEENRRLGTF